MNFNLRIILLATLGLLTSQKLVAQCTGYTIYASDSVGCENDIISFRVHPSPPSGSVLNWDFETKTVKNDANPSVAFTNADTITVSVEVELPTNQTCNLERKKYIRIGTNPKINRVTVSKAELCNTGLTSKLTVNAPTAIKHTWSIEGSVYSGVASTITHTFIRAGYANLQLISEGVFGCSTKKIFDSVVFVERKPDISFAYTDTTLCGASSIKLKPKTNYYSQNKFSHSWNFQGASPATSSSADPPITTYPGNTATYDVSVSIQSQITSCSHNYSFNDLVKVQNIPSIKLNATPLNGQGCKSENFALKVDANNIDSSQLRFFHFAKDSIRITRINADSAVVTGRKAGTFTVYALYGFANCQKLLTATVKVEPNEIDVDMDRSLECICNIPSSILITNKSTHSGSKAMSYEWQLINSKGKILANSTDTNFRWRADRYGRFTLSLKATDSDGCFEQTNFGFRASPFDLEFEASPGVACPKTAINFKLSDTLCYGEIDTVYWTFYELDNSLRRKYTGVDAVEKYQDTGWYAVEVEALTKEGCRSKLKRDSAVHIVELNSVKATVPQGPFCVGDLVRMKYSASPADLVGDWYGALISDDTTVYTQIGDSIIFRPNAPGTYDIKVVFTTKECTDSVVFKDAIEVGGAVFDFSPTKTTGCLPFSTTLNTNIIENVLIGTNDKTLSYEWAISPKSRGSFDDAAKKDPEITINKRGQTDITLVVKNAQGCATKLTKKGLFNFDLSASFELPDSFCSGIEYSVVNNSSGNIDTLKWYSSNSNLSVLPNDTSFNPRFVFDKPGTYDINLRLKGAGGCQEVVSKSIEVIDFGFDFSVDDTSAKCSPAPFEFSATGTNVDSFVWNFDDGSDELVTENDFTLKIYDLTRIAPYRNKFDVTLYGKNRLGCIDSIVSKELLTVLGPVPIFRFDNKVGCEPLEVNFVNNSINATKVYFDFDDNSSIDSVNIKKHTYFVEDSLQEFQVFRPFIVVRDNNDCQYSYRHPDSIIAYTKPIADFTMSKTKGCEPQTISFKDTSLFAYKWRWFFGDGDSLSDSTSLASHIYSAGKHKPTLIVENAIGCTDTSVFNSLRVYKTPIANFNTSEKVTCKDRPISFLDSSQTDFKLVIWQWDFGDTLAIDDTSNLENPTYTYDEPANYAVQLIVTDSNGCSDTLLKQNALEIVNRLAVDTPQIRFVSVWNDMGVSLETEAVNKGVFSTYELIETETLNDTLLEVFKRKDTTHLITGLMPDENRYCFKLEVIDKCEFRHPSDTHCTIFLDVDDTEKEVASLSWTPYIGWNSVKAYQVLRGLNGQALFPIARVPGTQFNYLDSSVCNELYEYEIEAIKEEDSLTSLSNGVEYQPEYVFQVNPLEMYLATVKNERVEVHWERSQQRNVKHYSIDRMANDNAWINEWKFLTDTFLIDSIAKTQSNYYMYRVRAVDECDYQSKKSIIANSILLNTNTTDRDFLLSWNPYKEWNAGVKEYVLERMPPNATNFNTIATLSASDTSFLDTSAFLQFNDPFAYRVYAVENGNNPDTSYSNIRIVRPLPTLFIPTAFSPNGDGTNDVFNFKSFALLADSVQEKNFEMRIYNRWGEEVYRTTDYYEGWDGSFNGQPCEIGNYIFLLKAQGKNGDLIFRKGGLILLR
ncbi:MAG: gliding motility-associated C-terminal domain-containing protein [Bacteroidia bacterium]